MPPAVAVSTAERVASMSTLGAGLGLISLRLLSSLPSSYHSDVTRSLQFLSVDELLFDVKSSMDVGGTIYICRRAGGKGICDMIAHMR